jgi:hypothetical protein
VAELAPHLIEQHPVVDEHRRGAVADPKRRVSIHDWARPSGAECPGASGIFPNVGGTDHRRSADGEIGDDRPLAVAASGERLEIIERGSPVTSSAPGVLCR